MRNECILESPSFFASSRSAFSLFFLIDEWSMILSNFSRPGMSLKETSPNPELSKRYFFLFWDLYDLFSVVYSSSPDLIQFGRLSAKPLQSTEIMSECFLEIRLTTFRGKVVLS